MPIFYDNINILKLTLSEWLLGQLKAIFILRLLPQHPWNSNDTDFEDGTVSFFVQAKEENIKKKLVIVYFIEKVWKATAAVPQQETPKFKFVTPCVFILS